MKGGRRKGGERREGEGKEGGRMNRNWRGEEIEGERGGGTKCRKKGRERQTTGSNIGI